jgi:hypothetical protein
MAKRTPDLIQIKIRMPRSLHQKLVRDAARTTADTINAQIVRRLEASYQSSPLVHDREVFRQATEAFVKATREVQQRLEEAEQRLEEAEKSKPITEDRTDDKETSTR